jgi:hypothetical protein
LLIFEHGSNSISNPDHKDRHLAYNDHILCHYPSASYVLTRFADYLPALDRRAKHSATHNSQSDENLGNGTSPEARTANDALQ